MVHKLSLFNTTYEFSWFRNNNYATIKDMKNQSTENEFYWSDNPTEKKFQSPPMKDKRKYSFLVSSYSLVKHKTLVSNILSTPLATVLKH